MRALSPRLVSPVIIATTLAVVACDASSEDAFATCAPGISPPLGAVLDWKLTESDTDPFPNRPDWMTCTEHGWGLDDGGVFGVYTGECDYVTVTQSLKVDLDPCNEIVIELSHDQLLAPQGEASGEVGFAINNELLWTKTFPIPAPPLHLGPIRIPVKKVIPAGTPIQFHVHNHGSNGWRLLRLDRILKGDPL
jgi:hypothetical protein